MIDFNEFVAKLKKVSSKFKSSSEKMNNQQINCDKGKFRLHSIATWFETKDISKYLTLPRPSMKIEVMMEDCKIITYEFKEVNLLPFYSGVKA